MDGMSRKKTKHTNDRDEQKFFLSSKRKADMQQCFVEPKNSPFYQNLLETKLTNKSATIQDHHAKLFAASQL